MNEGKYKQASFIEHLTELRSRLVKSIIYLFVFFIVCYFFAENIYSFLVSPYAEAVKAWRGASQLHVDDAYYKYVIVTLHKDFYTK